MQALTKLAFPTAKEKVGREVGKSSSWCFVIMTVPAGRTASTRSTTRASSGLRPLLKVWRITRIRGWLARSFYRFPTPESDT